MRRINIDDLFAGVVGVLARRGYSTVSIRTSRIDDAMCEVFDQLKTLAPKFDLDVRFTVTQDLHGNSPEVREAMAGAAQRDLVSLDNPEYQDMRFKSRALRLDLDGLPGGAELYEALTDAFVSSYEARQEVSAPVTA